MRIICTLVAAVFALTFAGAAYADCGCSKHTGCGCTQKHEGCGCQKQAACGCAEKHESCGCAKHGNKCGGDVQLMPDPPQCNEDMPQCCDRAEYTLCCEQAHFEMLCHEQPCKCKAEKSNDCGCDKCDKCSHKRCGCGKCPKRAEKDPVRD